MPPVLEKWPSALHSHGAPLLDRGERSAGDRTGAASAVQWGNMIRVGYFVLHAGCWVGAILASAFNVKLRRGLRARWRLVERLPPISISRHRELLWCHVASSGELEQALPILDRVKSRPNPPDIFISFFSPSGKKAIRLEAERRQSRGQALSWDGADYAPFDFPWSARAFVQRLRPAKLLLIHRELWPELIAAALAEGTEVYWVNVFITGKIPWFVRRLRHFVDRFKYIGCVDEQTLQAFRDFSKSSASPELEVGGDSRVDRTVERKLTASPSPVSVTPQKKILLLASIWKEDWLAISSGVFELLRRSPEWEVWVFPHELNARLADGIGRDFAKRKQPLTVRAHWNLDSVFPAAGGGNLYFNLIGKLAEAYRFADLVFVGASFKAKVHNVLEPAAYGKPILTGPYIQNSREALRFNQGGGLWALAAHDFSAALLELTYDSGEQRQQMAVALQRDFARLQGAAGCYARRLF